VKQAAGYTMIKTVCLPGTSVQAVQYPFLPPKVISSMTLL